MRLIDADRFDEDGGHYLRARLEFPDGKKTNGYFAVLTSVQIKDAPTVDAVPVVHAHWFAEKDDGGFFDFCLCSNCKFDFGNEIAWVLPSVELPYYCPRCGAKMDEEVNDD